MSEKKARKLRRDEIMTKDFSTVLRNADKTPMKRTPAPDSPEVTIGEVIGDALLAVTESDRGLSGDQKNQRYKLWKKLEGGGEKSFNLEEASMIKQVVGNVYGPIVVGQVYDFLEEN
jgi:hypothetical protein